MKVRDWIVRVLVILSLFVSLRAGAQSDQERAAARAAAREGIAAFERRDYVAAIEYLERAEAVIHAPTHLLFIARSQVELGKFVEARESYQKIITENLSTGAPKAFLEAQEAAREEMPPLEGKIARLVIAVRPKDGGVVNDLEVRLNGEPLPRTLVGVPTPINPGKNVIVVRARGMEDVSQEIELAEGQSRTLEVVLRAAEAPVSTKAEPASNSRDEATGRTKSGRKTAGWISLGSGAALLATGSVFGVLTLQQVSRAASEEDLCGQDDRCTKEGRKELDQAKVKGLVSDIGIGVGIAAIGVGTYLLLTGKKANPAKVGVRDVLPHVDQRGATFSIRGAF